MFLLKVLIDFEGMQVAEDNEKENPNESYTNKYQNHAPCSYGYKSVCVYDKFRKPFKSYLGEDSFHCRFYQDSQRK